MLFKPLVSNASRCFVFAAIIGPGLCAGISITLAPSAASPQPVGTSITWTAIVTDGSSGGHEYQFSVTGDDGITAVVRDFHTNNSFVWTPSATEGTYAVSVKATNTANLETARATQRFVVTSLLIEGLAAVNPTAHPLVALFSAPPCRSGNSIRVRFHLAGSTVSQYTNTIACSPTNSANFYIAGMYPDREYVMRYETLSPSGVLVRSGSDLTFTTGGLPSSIVVPPTSVLVQATLPTSASAPILLHDYLPVGSKSEVPIATDLNGDVLWYYPIPVSLLTRTETGGKMFVIYTGNTNPYQQLLREIDLAGNITLETNVNRINEQLSAKGKRHINAFHHEARRLADGHIAVLASDEMLTTSAQGGTTAHPVDVLGAQVLILDRNLQLKWAWDAFDFLDLNRPANLGEVCSAGRIGCPVFFRASEANDWLHANSIQETSDGNLLISLRHQDWIIKINYANGLGDGSVIWRMGYQGDFTLQNPPTSPLCVTSDQQDAYQWFTHQHDANFQLGGNTILSVYDNGNLRRAKCDTNGNSRGYVLNVDEAGRRAVPTLVADLGEFSFGLGTAELIPGSSNYHFESGWILPGPYSISTELNSFGVTQFAMKESNAATYRSYRMHDLYTPAQQ
jgi:hypothetical protein